MAAPRWSRGRWASSIAALAVIVLGFALGIRFYAEATPGNPSRLPDRLLLGQVLTASGAPAPLAMVYLVDIDQGKERATITDASGRFQFDPLKGAGHYQVFAQLNAAQTPLVSVDPGRSMIVEVKLAFS